MPLNLGPKRKSTSDEPPAGAHAGELDGSVASYPAVPITQNAHRFYFTTIPVKDIYHYCFVSRREEDPMKGFQRILNQHRADDIANYLDTSQGSIPTNIVLSAQDNAELTYTRSTKSLRYKRLEKAFLVLDGQHRLYGYSRTKKPHRVPVAIYENLTRAEEAALFIDINTNQRGVPAALLLDIKQVAERESTEQTQMREWFDRLNDDPQSPLCGYLSKAQSKTGFISRVTFNRGVQPILQNVVIAKLPHEKQYVLLRNYLTAAEGALHTKSLFRRSAYFEAFCDVFDDVMRLARTNRGDMKIDTLSDVFGAIHNIDLENLPTGGKQNLTKSSIVPAMKAALAGQIEVDEDMV